MQTFEGIDVCGERLAAEIRAVVEQHPGLARISLLGHSMGGLIRWGGGGCSRFRLARLPVADGLGCGQMPPV